MVPKPAEKLKKQIEELEEEKANLLLSNQNQLHEISQLQKELERLDSVELKLSKEKQKCKEQEKRLTQLETELTETRRELDRAQKEEIVSYRDKLAKSSSEIGFLSKRLRAQEAENVKLQSNVKNCLVKLEESEMDRQRYENEIENLKGEIDAMEKQQILANDRLKEDYNPSFKEFVKLKRKMRELETENTKLQYQLQRAQCTKSQQYLSDEPIDPISVR